MPRDNRLANLCERFWHFQCHEFPITAIRAGVETRDDYLLREAPADHERRASFARKFLTEVDSIGEETLDVQDRASLRLLRRELMALCRKVELDIHLRPPLYPVGPEFAISFFAGTQALTTIGDARRYLARMATVPDGLNGVRTALSKGLERGIKYPRLIIERAVSQLRGLITVPIEQSAFYGPFQRATCRIEGFAMEAQCGMALIRDTIYPAYAAYADFVETSLGAAARESLACIDAPLGEAFYRSMVEQFASIEADPEDVHQIGLNEVSRITAEMDAVAAAAGFPGDLAGFRRQLQGANDQFAASAEALREQIEILSKRIDARIPEFFGRTPRTTYGVQSIPEAIAEKMPPAYAQPNPANNSSAGVHWITSIPRKCPRYMHVPLALHEAWPGHLMHLALIQEMDALPAFRRFGDESYSACFEGWALYCEWLGEEMGFYDTPVKRYGRLEMEMLRAVRLVVDTALHWKGWSREKTLDFLREHLTLPAAALEPEVDRYIGFPGQALAYQLGNLKIREMRRRAEERLGEHFRVRDFHDALMAIGPVTLPILEDLMNDWIEARAKKQAA